MESTIRSHEEVWDAGSFVGGALCLDFANTQGGLDKTRDLERLPNYRQAVDWSRAAQAISAQEAKSLSAMALKAPMPAEGALRRLQAFRECLYRLFSALAANRQLDPADEAAVRRAVSAALDAAHLERDAGGCAWKVSVEKAGFDTVLGRIALDAERLLLGSELAHVRECDRCSWLFVDRSKNKRRRWCKTETCGNRTRAARHYQLAKTSARS